MKNAVILFHPSVGLVLVLTTSRTKKAMKVASNTFQAKWDSGEFPTEGAEISSLPVFGNDSAYAVLVHGGASDGSFEFIQKHVFSFCVNVAFQAVERNQSEVTSVEEIKSFASNLALLQLNKAFTDSVEFFKNPGTEAIYDEDSDLMPLDLLPDEPFGFSIIDASTGEFVASTEIAGNEDFRRDFMLHKGNIFNLIALALIKFGV
jgi:hypothetical protein